MAHSAVLFKKFSSITFILNAGLGIWSLVYVVKAHFLRANMSPNLRPVSPPERKPALIVAPQLLPVSWHLNWTQPFLNEVVTKIAILFIKNRKKKKIAKKSCNLFLWTFGPNHLQPKLGSLAEGDNQGSNIVCFWKYYDHFHALTKWGFFLYLTTKAKLFLFLLCAVSLFIEGHWQRAVWWLDSC